MLSAGEVLDAFGLDPREIDSVRGTEWWIVGTPQMVDSRGGAKPGCLCIRSDIGLARYKGLPMMMLDNFLGISLEDNLKKWRYYFRPYDVERGLEGYPPPST